MSKRISPEEKVLAYFRDSDLAAAEAMLRVVQATVKARQPVQAKRVKAKKAVTAASTPAPISLARTDA